MALVVNDKVLTMDTGAFALKIDGISIFVCSSFIDLFIGFYWNNLLFEFGLSQGVVKNFNIFQNVFLTLNDGGKM